MQAKPCGKLGFFTQGPECLSFSRLEAQENSKQIKCEEEESVGI